jgi:hypothetical protein
MHRSMVRLLGFTSVILGSASWASAGPVFNFYRITDNSSLGDIGGQFEMEVDAGLVGTNDVPGVHFTFRNMVGTASSITDIYFDDGTLLAGPTVESQTLGVNFASGATPRELPGANAVEFDTTQGFSADSNPAVAPNGINASTESLILGFTLQGTQTVDDTINALATGALRVGLRVQALPDEDSDGYVNGAAVVPLPAAAWMGMSLLGSVGGAGLYRRRRTLACR